MAAEQTTPGWLQSLTARVKSQSGPGSAYAVDEAAHTFGLDALPSPDDELLVDEGRMSVRLPFADGNSRDGVGDLIEVAGIELSRHRQNPIALYDHGKQVSLPVGLTQDRDTGAYTVDISEPSRKAYAEIFFYQGKGLGSVSKEREYDHALFCHQLFDLMARRLVRGGSIGYTVIAARELPPDHRTGTPKGLHLMAVKMLEVSAVVLPANQDTVGKSFLHDPEKHFKAMSETAREILCLPGVCGKSLSPALVKSLEPWARDKTTHKIADDEVSRAAEHHRQAQDNNRATILTDQLSSQGYDKVTADLEDAENKVALAAHRSRQKSQDDAAAKVRDARENARREADAHGGAERIPPERMAKIDADISAAKAGARGLKDIRARYRKKAMATEDEDTQGEAYDVASARAAAQLPPESSDGLRRQAERGGLKIEKPRSQREQDRQYKAMATEDEQNDGLSQSVQAHRESQAGFGNLYPDHDTARRHLESTGRKVRKPITQEEQDAQYKRMPEEHEYDDERVYDVAAETAQSHSDAQRSGRPAPTKEQMQDVILNSGGRIKPERPKPTPAPAPTDSKALTALKKKYRAVKSVRRKVRSSRAGSATLAVRHKDVRAARDKAESQGLGFAWLRDLPHGAKVRLTGPDERIDEFAREFGVPMQKSLPGYEVKSEQRKDKRGRTYCVQQGEGIVPCGGQEVTQAPPQYSDQPPVDIDRPEGMVSRAGRAVRQVMHSVGIGDRPRPRWDEPTKGSDHRRTHAAVASYVASAEDPVAAAVKVLIHLTRKDAEEVVGGYDEDAPPVYGVDGEYRRTEGLLERFGFTENTPRHNDRWDVAEVIAAICTGDPAARDMLRDMNRRTKGRNRATAASYGGKSLPASGGKRLVGGRKSLDTQGGAMNEHDDRSVADGPSEPYGAAVLRRCHEDKRLLLPDYDEMIRLTENEHVRKILTRMAEDHVRHLDEIESAFGKHYKDLPALEGMESDEDDFAEEGDEGEVPDDIEELEEEVGKDLDGDMEEGEDLDHLDAVLGDEDNDAKDMGDLDMAGVGADSDDSRFDTIEEDDATHSMKSLRRRYGKGLKKRCKCGSCSACKKGKGLDQGDYARQAEDDEDVPAEEEEILEEHEEYGHTDDGDASDETLSGGSGFADHELAGLREAHEFLQAIGGENSSFSEEDRMKAYHFHKLLEGIAGPLEDMQDPGLPDTDALFSGESGLKSVKVRGKAGALVGMSPRKIVGGIGKLASAAGEAVGAAVRTVTGGDRRQTEQDAKQSRTSKVAQKVGRAAGKVRDAADLAVIRSADAVAGGVNRATAAASKVPGVRKVVRPTQLNAGDVLTAPPKVAAAVQRASGAAGHLGGSREIQGDE